MTKLLVILFAASFAQAAPSSFSFHGNLAGTSSVSSMVLTFASGGCPLFQTADYGSVALDADGNFSVPVTAAGGTFPGNSSGASYTKLSEIFNSANPVILGDSGCTVNGPSAAWEIFVEVNGVPLSGSVPVHAVPFSVSAETADDARKISGVPVAATAPSTNQILQFIGGAWTPTSISSGGVSSIAGTSPLVSSGGTNPTISLAGLTGLGSSNQILGLNAAASGFEYKTLSTGSGLSLAHATNSISVQLNGELAGLNALTSTGVVRRTGVGTYSAGSTSLATDVAGTLPVVNGGTNSSTALSGNRMMVSTSSSIVESAALAASLPLRTNAVGLPTTGSIDLSSEVTGTLPLNRGGTNSTTGSITGTGALQFTAGGSGQNVVLTPSSGGAVVLNGDVGIGTAIPFGKLHVYESSNAPANVSIGVSGLGTNEFASLNLLTRSGHGSLGTSGSKGFQLWAGGDSSPYADFFGISHWNGSSETNLLTLGSGYSTLGTSLKISSYESAGYSTTSSSLSHPNGQHLLISNNYSSTNASAMSIYDLGSAQSAYVGAARSPSGYSPAIVFGVQTGPSAYEERMRLHPDGNLGIGVIAPKAKLDVGGGIRTRTLYPSCSTGCSNLSLSLGQGNSFFIPVASGSITMGASNATDFVNFEGAEFSVTVCGAGSSTTVNFGGPSSGFVSGVSWSTVLNGSCTSQKFIVMRNGANSLAHPLAPAINYAY